MGVVPVAGMGVYWAETRDGMGGIFTFWLPSLVENRGVDSGVERKVVQSRKEKKLIVVEAVADKTSFSTDFNDSLLSDCFYNPAAVQIMSRKNLRILYAFVIDTVVTPVASIRSCKTRPEYGETCPCLAARGSEVEQ